MAMPSGAALGGQFSGLSVHSQLRSGDVFFRADPWTAFYVLFLLLSLLLRTHHEEKRRQTSTGCQYQKLIYAWYQVLFLGGGAAGDGE